MLGDDEAIVNLDSKVQPAILASILDCNVSWLYQCSQAGRLPNPIIDYNYKECLQQYISFYKNKQELLLEKEANAQKLKEAKLLEDTKFKESKLRAKQELEEKAREAKGKNEFFGDDGMPPLLAAKTKQDIRLGVAREQQLWLKTAIERGEYLSTVELIELCEPILMTIRQGLLTIALSSDENQVQVDLIMEQLYRFGVSMVEQAKLDSDTFIKTIMDKEIDLTEIDIDSLPEPIL